MNWNWLLRPWVAWRARETRLTRELETVPAVLARFAEGEIIPLKGIQFKVGHVREQGIVLYPIADTRRAVHNKWAKTRRRFRIAAREADQHVAR
jgi:hypothetical protein